MSFIDPDLRERWAKEAEAKRQHCKGNGHSWPDRVGPCAYCSAEHPDAKKPVVRLMAGDYRAVFKPADRKVIIEKSSWDSMGVARWDKISEISDSSEDYPIYLLLSKGVKQ